MAFTKIGEAIEFRASDLLRTDVVLADQDILNKMSSDDSAILAEFRKVAAALKQIAPKAKDFLYFSAIMMHAAEASLLDSSGRLKKDASGRDVSAHWDKKGGTWRWVCSDPSIMPYKNSNADIFPEEELIKAHKKWRGRPLCLDHKSSSVDMIRGVIVDTYYDHSNKRVIALCALDKVNYPDLARKVSTGYANSVSMGTAVGKAICTDCGQVARIESDFCDHMRRKSCYGEINVDLNPIELSIVVNGADPNAKIRHIVASAQQSIAQYQKMKETGLLVQAEDETHDIELSQDIKDGLNEVSDLVSSLKEKIDQLKSSEESEQQEYEESKPVEAAAEQDFAVKNASMLEAILNQVNQLNDKLNKLSREENEMTQKTAYFQGAGGVNEPSPGKPKYEKEDAESIRNNQDKQVESPQDTGPVDGLFPGDEAKKKGLQRLAAEAQERAVRRHAAFERAKQAYLQGGGGPNEPTPGKPKYEKEDSDKIREKGDSQMGGPAPFPGVGKVDGLYDKDLEAKKKLLRASVKANFITAYRPDGTVDKGASRWDVRADGKLVFSATVDEMTGGKADALYSSIKTAECGRELLNKLKTESFDKVVALYKGGQALPGLPAPADPLPPAAPAPVPMPAGPETAAEPALGEEDPSKMDKGDDGNPKDQLKDLTHELSNLAADLSQVSDAITNESSNELDEMGQLGDGTTVAALLDMRKKLAHALRLGSKQLLEEVKEHLSELKLAEMLVSDESVVKTASAERKESIANIINDACGDAKRTLANGQRLKVAFVKYARGTQAVVKRAKKEIELMKTAQISHDPLDPTLTTSDGKIINDKGTAAPGPVAPKPAPKPAKPAVTPSVPLKSKNPNKLSPQELEMLHRARPGRGELLDPMLEGYSNKALTTQYQKPEAQRQNADDMDMKDKEKDENDLKASPDGSLEGSAEEVGKALKEMQASFNLNDASDRAALRAKLAEKGAAKYNKVLDEAHPKGGHTTQLDVKPTGDLAKVETLSEVHDAMEMIATAPPRVRKMAEEIQKFVVAGAINPDSDFNELLALGLDGDAVKYWKAFYGQSKDGGSQFAADFVKEHHKAKQAEERKSHEVKVARAYDLAYQMADRGLVGRDAAAIKLQADEIMTWNDEGFASVQAMIARQPLSKQASAMPQVGMIGNGDITIPAPEAEPSDLRRALEAHFARKRY